MSSSIDNITCPKCREEALRETDHKTGEIYDHCNNCGYEKIITEVEEPKKYKIVDNNDGNIEIELESNTREEAIEEALGVLGWGIVECKNEE